MASAHCVIQSDKFFSIFLQDISLRFEKMLLPYDERENV